MTGTSGIRPDATTTLDAAVGRSANHSGREQAATSRFEDLLNELGPAPKDEGMRAPAAARLGGGSPGLAGAWSMQDADTGAGDARGHADGAAGAAALMAAEDATLPETEGMGAGGDAVTLEVTTEGIGLADGVAGSIAAALDGNRADRVSSADAAPELRPAAGERRPEGPERARPGAGITGPAIETGPGPRREGPAALSVLRGETYFRPAPSGAAGHFPDRIGWIGREAEGASAGGQRGAVSEAAVATARRDAAPGLAGFGSRRDAASEAAVTRAGVSPEAAGAGMKRGSAAETPGASTWHGTLPEATFGARSGAFPGGATGASAGPDAGGAGVRFEAPPVLRASPTHVVAGTGPVRLLHLRLQPAELGTLEVRMRMTDAGLDIHVEASRRETFALLQRDRDLLAGILRNAGHTLEGVTVSLGDRAAGQPQAAAQDGWQPPIPDGRQDAQAGGPRERGGRAGDHSPSRPGDGRAIDEVQDDEDRPALAARRHGNLYL